MGMSRVSGVAVLAFHLRVVSMVFGRVDRRCADLGLMRRACNLLREIGTDTP